MRHQATRDLYAHWNAMRGQRTAPDRTDIDPVLLRSALGATFVLEVDAGRGYPFCLAGDRVNGLFGTMLKGRSFTALWPDSERGQITALLANVCDEALPVIAGIKAAPAAKPLIGLELLLLPLRHAGKTHSRMLGCLSPATPPDWFGILPIADPRLVSMRILKPQFASLHNPSLPVTGMRRAADLVAPAILPANIGQRAHLTVYQGGKSASVNQAF